MSKILHRGALAVIVAALLWSIDGLLRLSLYTAPPAVVVFWEHLLGCLVIAPFVLRSWHKFKQLSRRQWASIVLVGLLSGTVGTIAYTAALGQVNYIPFSVVILLQQLNPIFAIGAAAIVLRERLKRKFILLAAIALLGAYMTTFPQLTVNFATGQGTIVAASLAVGAAAAWGISTAFSKYSLQGTSFIHITAARFGITALFSLMFIVGSGSYSAAMSVTAPQFMTLIIITLSTGLVALAIYYYGLQRIAASNAAILELAWPLSSVCIGWLWLGQSLTLTQLIGAGILLSTTYTIAQMTTDSTSWRCRNPDEVAESTHRSKKSLAAHE